MSNLRDLKLPSIQERNAKIRRDQAQRNIPKAAYIPEKKYDEETNSKMLSAITSGEHHLLEELISSSNNYNINYADADGNNYLHLLLSSSSSNVTDDNKVAIATLLINNGINYDKPNNQNVTPLMLAASNVNLPILTLLLEKGANVNNINNDKRNALYYCLTKYITECSKNDNNTNKFDKIETVKQELINNDMNNNIGLITSLVAEILATTYYKRYLTGMTKTIYNVLGTNKNITDELEILDKNISNTITNNFDRDPKTTGQNIINQILGAIPTIYDKIKDQTFSKVALPDYNFNVDNIQVNKNNISNQENNKWTKIRMSLDQQLNKLETISHNLENLINDATTVYYKFGTLASIYSKVPGAVAVGGVNVNIRDDTLRDTLIELFGLLIFNNDNDINNDKTIILLDHNIRVPNGFHAIMNRVQIAVAPGVIPMISFDNYKDVFLPYVLFTKLKAMIATIKGTISNNKDESLEIFINNIINILPCIFNILFIILNINSWLKFSINEKSEKLAILKTKQDLLALLYKHRALLGLEQDAQDFIEKNMDPKSKVDIISKLFKDYENYFSRQSNPDGNKSFMSYFSQIIGQVANIYELLGIMTDYVNTVSFNNYVRGLLDINNNFIDRQFRVGHAFSKYLQINVNKSAIDKKTLGYDNFDFLNINKVNEFRQFIYETYFIKINKDEEQFTYYIEQMTNNNPQLKMINDYYNLPPVTLIGANLTNMPILADDVANIKNGILIYDKNNELNNLAMQNITMNIDNTTTNCNAGPNECTGKFLYVQDYYTATKSMYDKYFVNNDNIQDYTFYLITFLLEHFKLVTQNNYADIPNANADQIRQKYSKIKKQISKITASNLYDKDELIYIIMTKVGNDLIKNYVNEKVTSYVCKYVLTNYRRVLDAGHVDRMQILSIFDREIFNNFKKNFKDDYNDVRTFYGNLRPDDYVTHLLKYDNMISKNDKESFNKTDESNKIIHYHLPNYTVPIIKTECVNNEVEKLVVNLIDHNCNIEQKDIYNNTPISFIIKNIYYPLFNKIIHNVKNKLVDPNFYINSLNKEIKGHGNKLLTLDDYKINLTFATYFTNNVTQGITSINGPNYLPLYIDNLGPQLLIMFNNYLYCDVLYNNVVSDNELWTLLYELYEKQLLIYPDPISDFSNMKKTKLRDIPFLWNNNVTDNVVVEELQVLQNILEDNNKEKMRYIINDSKTYGAHQLAVAERREVVTAVSNATDANYVTKMARLINSLQRKSVTTGNKVDSLDQLIDDIAISIDNKKMYVEAELSAQRDNMVKDLVPVKNAVSLYSGIFYGIKRNFYVYNVLWSNYIKNLNNHTNIHLVLSSYVQAYGCPTDPNIKNTMNKIYKYNFVENIERYLYLDNFTTQIYNENDTLKQIIDIVAHIIGTNILGNMLQHIMGTLVSYIVNYYKNDYVIILRKLNDKNIKNYVYNEMPKKIVIGTLFQTTETNVSNIFRGVTDQVKIMVPNIKPEVIESIDKIIEFYEQLVALIIPLMKQLIDCYCVFIINEYRYLLMHDSLVN